MRVNYTFSVQDTSSVFSEQPKHLYQLSQHFSNIFGFCFHILISLPRDLSQPCLKPFLPAAHWEEKKGGKELREMSFPGTSVWVNDLGQKNNGSNSSKRICRHLCVQRRVRGHQQTGVDDNRARVKTIMLAQQKIIEENLNALIQQIGLHIHP